MTSAMTLRPPLDWVLADCLILRFVVRFSFYCIARSPVRVFFTSRSLLLRAAARAPRPRFPPRRKVHFCYQAKLRDNPRPPGVFECVVVSGSSTRQVQYIATVYLSTLVLPLHRARRPPLPLRVKTGPTNLLSSHPILYLCHLVLSSMSCSSPLPITSFSFYRQVPAQSRHPDPNTSRFELFHIRTPSFLFADLRCSCTASRCLQEGTSAKKAIPFSKPCISAMISLVQSTPLLFLVLSCSTF